MKFKGKIIVISGIDGCGKTSIIKRLIKYFSENGEETRYVWLRYNHYITKFLLAFCRVSGLTEYENVQGIRLGYHEFYRSKIISFSFILLTYIDTLLVSLVRVYIPAVFSKKQLICDRWIIDIMVDLEIDTGVRFVKGSFLSNFFKKMVPKNAHYFLIERNQEEALKVRKENRLDKNFSKRIKIYQRHSMHPYVIVVNNSRSIQDTLNQITKFL
jgi:thymidylate kinase